MLATATHHMAETRRRYGFDDLPIFVDMHGTPRILANISKPGALKKAFPKAYGAYNPMWTMAQIKAVDRRPLFGSADWILDQNGIGSCVGNGSTGALRRKRVLMGLPDVKLSPGCCYSQINGGSDNGAVISDALTALLNTGTVSYATIGESPFYTRQMPSGWQTEAKRFRVTEAYHATTYLEVLSAIMNDDVPFYGMMVGNNFESFNANGVAGASGGPGNHCMMAEGIVMIGSVPYIDNVNSWNFSWGPFKNGRCLLSQQHIDGGGDEPDVCIITGACIDPQSPPLPTPAA